MSLIKRVGNSSLEKFKNVISNIFAIFTLVSLPFIFFILPFVLLLIIVLVITFLGTASDAIFGFSTFFLLPIGLPLIYVFYRLRFERDQEIENLWSKKNGSRVEILNRLLEDRKLNGDSYEKIDIEIERREAYFNDKEDNQIGFTLLALTYTLIVIRFDVAFVPRFYAINILAIIFVMALYYLYYRPLDRLKVNVQVRDINSFPQRELTQWRMVIFGILLVAALLSGYLEYEDSQF